MKLTLPACVVLPLFTAAGAWAHPGPRVWVGGNNGEIAAFASDNDLSPSSYFPSRVFIGGVDEESLTTTGLLDELVPGAGVFSTEFPGFQVRTTGGNIGSGATIGFNIAGPLRYFDQPNQQFVTTQQAFGSPGPAPQMGVSIGGNVRTTSSGSVTGFNLLVYNSGDAHGHAFFTLYGDGTGPSDGPTGVYAIPLQLTGAGLTDSKPFYILFGRDIDMTQPTYQQAIAVAHSLKWAGTSSARTWDFNTSSNWIDFASASQRFLPGDSVTFDDSAGVAGASVLLQGALSPTSVTVNNSTAVPYSLSSATGGSITGSASLTKTGNGLLTINTNNTYTGATTVTGGTLDASGGSIVTSAGPMSVTGAGSRLIAGKIAPTSLTVGSGAKVTLTNVDTFGNLAGRSTVGAWDNSGLVDLGKTGIIIAMASEAVIRAQVLSARAGGAWTGTAGITSANVAANPGSRGIGYVVNGSQITVAQTVLGDANLDAIVNIDDLSILAQNYNLSSRNWQNGDYNYDGVVNIDDLSLLAQNYNQQASDLGAVFPGAGAGFAADYATIFNGVPTVPEPGMFGGISLVMSGLLARVRKSCAGLRRKSVQ